MHFGKYSKHWSFLSKKNQDEQKEWRKFVLKIQVQNMCQNVLKICAKNTCQKYVLKICAKNYAPRHAKKAESWKHAVRM